MNMKTLAAASAAFGLLASASVANAAVTVITSPGYPVADDLLGTTLAANGMTMLYDFDSIADANVTYVGNVVTTTPNPITNSAPPPWSGGVPVGGTSALVDPTNYAAVLGGTTGTFSAVGGYALTSFSFYLGSPDSYNKMTFTLLDGTTQEFKGKKIWGGTPAGDGNRAAGYRVYYDFGGAKVKSITFASSTDSFEFDGLAGTVGVVPEPGTWALMIMGFGGAGAMIRRRKAALA